MNLDNPDRYDLDPDGNCYGDCGNGCKAALERRGNGDWVSYDDYSALLEAHDALAKRLEQIAEIAR